MALLNSFDYLDRSGNLGKLTTNPLTVRFSTDGVGQRRTGETTSYCLARRYVQKDYSWNGYTLDAAKRIANYYAQGNAQRCGYYRRYREYTFDSTTGWTYRNVWQSLSDVSVVRQAGNMYSVVIHLDETDEFLVDASNIPDSYDAWCSAFSTFYRGDEWAAVDFSKNTPYTFEKFYDEPLTQTEASNG